jgi:large subunit ribosomal protein L18
MKKFTGRKLRHIRIRKKVFGTPEKPRMVLYRSLKNMYVQLVDDISHKTLMSLSTGSPDVRKETADKGSNVKAATALGMAFAKLSLEKGIKKVVFDRSGYMYHGRVKALAEAVLKGGLSFGDKVRKEKKKDDKEIKKNEKDTKKEETQVKKTKDIKEQPIKDTKKKGEKEIGRE